LRILTEVSWPCDFLTAARNAAQLATQELNSSTSPLWVHTRRWLATRCDLSHPEDYFLHSQSLAILGFPWWLEESLRGVADPAFQADLMFSTINAYYFTRMLDDIMDGHAIERAAMPALYPFHLRFMRPYQKYFDYSSAFWGEFERILMITVEAVAGEASLEKITEEDFIRFSARKPAAAVIPLAAVCVHYGRIDMLALWESVLTSFARWHQMRDDIMDWSSDMQAGQPSWLLTEAARRRNAEEPVAAWMGREGFRWAKNVMDRRIKETLEAASELKSQALLSYIQQRNELFSKQIGNMIATADAFAGLLAMDQR
jgi:hypothetical protein